MVFGAIRAQKSIRAGQSQSLVRAPLGLSGLVLAAIAVVVVMGLAMLAFVSVGGSPL